jgi:hypothetical protein
VSGDKGRTCDCRQERNYDFLKLERMCGSDLLPCVMLNYWRVRRHRPDFEVFVPELNTPRDPNLLSSHMRCERRRQLSHLARELPPLVQPIKRIMNACDSVIHHVSCQGQSCEQKSEIKQIGTITQS